MVLKLGRCRGWGDFGKWDREGRGGSCFDRMDNGVKVVKGGGVWMGV